MDASPQPTIARVYVELKSRSLDRPFDYRIPPQLSGKISPGSVVLVPLGRQKTLGIVSELTRKTTIDSSRLVDIEALVDYPPLPETLIHLAEWISGYYYCSPAVALATALPPGGLPPLKKRDGDGEPRYTLGALAVRSRQVRFARLAQPGGETGSDGHTDAQARVLEVLAREGELPVSELRRKAQVSRSPVDTLARKGKVDLVDRKVRRHTLRYYGSSDQEVARAPLELNRDQELALAAIIGRLDAPAPVERSRPILLAGVAGAGKTEIYLRAIEAAVERGRSSIVLVPEISLTHQALKRFRRRFGERVGIMHSGLGLGERYDEYRRIRAGEVDVVIGPRSAIFAPLPNLGLIVVDEENDGSFKQENDPRYDARRVALERAHLEGASLVYGSATPSLESYSRIEDRFFLPERATGARMPQVEIIDMRQEEDQVFSRRLVKELDANLAAGGKSILLLNRRGYARYLQCGHCGHVWKCDNCDVSLTIHSRIRRLRCHHCGHHEDMPDICPVCGSSELKRWGVGTERLEHMLSKRFPEANLFRLDADTAEGYGEGPRILEQFAHSDKAILLGTQMVAKGHHFPEVTLAVVINADLALQFPEFRAEEQTFAILQQLSGRSGRADRPGKVLIQTWNADIECIKMAAEHRLGEFYRRELDRRRMLDYPPYRQLINIVCLSRRSGKADEAAAFLKEKIGPVLGDDEQVLGPAGLFRLQGWSRSHILVKTDNIEAALDAMRPLLEHYRAPFSRRGVRLVVDVDPQWLS